MFKKLSVVAVSLLLFVGLVPASAKASTLSTVSVSNSSDYRDNFSWFSSATNFSPSIPFKGKGIKVAVLDTGVDGTHPVLRDNVLAGFDSLTFEEIPPQTFSDFDGHGTHVAGLVNFFAPKAEIIPVRVLGPNNTGVDNPIASGIYWAVEHGADVINLSLASTSDFNTDINKGICSAIDFALESNVVVVSASGNSGSFDNPEVFPASCSNSISVAAVNESLSPAWFSSYDANVSLAAPGTNIVSTLPKSKAANFNATGFGSFSGTSMASPIVAGAAALLLESGVSPKDVKTVLTSNSSDILPQGRDPFTGSGLLDFSKLFNYPAQSYHGFTPVELVSSHWSDGSTFFSFKPSVSLPNPNYVVIVSNLSANTVDYYPIPRNFVRFSFPTPKSDLVGFSILDTVSNISSPVFMAPNDGFMERSSSKLTESLELFQNVGFKFGKNSPPVSDFAVIVFKKNFFKKSGEVRDTKFFVRVVLAGPKGLYSVSFSKANTITLPEFSIKVSRKYGSVTFPVSKETFVSLSEFNDYLKTSVKRSTQ